MSSKPNSVCQLTRGKLIDTCKGFVETFNWLALFVANLKGEDEEDGKLTISIDGDTGDTPVLKINGEAGMKLKSGTDSNIVIGEKDKDGYYPINFYYK